jgi:hypothetical protein
MRKRTTFTTEAFIMFSRGSATSISFGVLLFALAGVGGAACSSPPEDSAGWTEQHLEDQGAIAAAIDKVIDQPRSVTFKVTENDPDHITAVATTTVATRTLSIQLLLMGTATLNAGGTPPSFIQQIAGGTNQTLGIEFTGEFSGVDASGADVAIARADVASRILDTATPTMCGTRTHNAVVRLSAPNRETVKAVGGLKISYPDTSGSGSGGVGPMGPSSLHVLADEPATGPKPPADGAPCPEKRSYGFVYYPDPECGNTLCYNLTWVKQKRVIKAAVDVSKGGGSGSVDSEIEVDTPVWVAGSCRSEFAFSIPSYYYCKCDTSQLGKPK